MATEVEFTPLSLEKWQKVLVSTDPSEKTLGMKLLKAAAKHNGKKNVLAYMSKSAEEKAEVIFEFQQDVKPYKANGASDVDHEDDDDEKVEAKTEEKTTKKRKTSTRKTRKRRENAAAKTKSDDEDDAESQEEASAHKGGPTATEVDLGPLKADLSTIKEALETGSEERNALDEKLNTVIKRMSGLEKFLIETHAMMRFFVSSQEGMYEMMTDQELVEEFYGKSAFEEESEGN